MLELLSEQLLLSLKKPFLRNYSCAYWSGKGKNSLLLVEPLTYMNRSGDILPSLMKRKKAPLSGLIVVTDNMDLPPGKVRMKLGGSSAGHNGLKSIMSRTGTGDFYRLYIGVGRPEKGVSVVDHVLGEFSRENRLKMEEAVKKCAEIFLTLKDRTPGQVMNEINAGKS